MKNEYRKILILVFIFSLPYNNFPYGVGGTLTPLALIPLTSLVLVHFLKFMEKGYTKVKRPLFIIINIFFLFLLITIYNDIYFWDHFTNSKIISPIFRTSQFVIYSFITIGSFWIGYKSLYYFKSADYVLKLVLVSFIPSLVFGILEILFKNNHILNLTRSLVANTKFPDGYYRIYLLTTEPSWAAFDVATFIIPLSIYFYLKRRNMLYLLILTTSIIVFIFIKSILGFIVITLSLFIFILLHYKAFLIKVKYFIAFTLLFFIIIGASLIFKDVYLERLNKFFQGADPSGLTRTVSYMVALEIFKNYPFLGVGFRNTGYFYGDIVYSKYPELLNIPLIEDWANFNSKRFPDIKSTFLEIMASSGLVGTFTILTLFIILIKKVKQIERKSFKYLSLFMIISSTLGSFSISLIGYPIYWFFLGIIFNTASRRIE